MTYKNPKTFNMFPENPENHKMLTRYPEKYQVDPANTERLRNSLIIYMQNILNVNKVMNLLSSGIILFCFVSSEF